MADATRAPLRCPTADGYIRIKVPGHPVALDRGWALEHRYVAWETFGPFDPDMHVHHINGNRSDNRPENLELLSASEHLREHGERRRVVDLEQAAAMYEAGASTTEIANRFGTYAGNVSRLLRSVGVQMRDSGTGRRVTGHSSESVRSAHASSTSSGEVARKLGVTKIVARRLMRDLGLPSFPIGRPRKVEA